MGFSEDLLEIIYDETKVSKHDMLRSVSLIHSCLGEEVELLSLSISSDEYTDGPTKYINKELRNHLMKSLGSLEMKNSKSKLNIDFTVQVLIDILFSFLNYSKKKNLDKSRQTEFAIHRFLQLIFGLLLVKKEKNFEQDTSVQKRYNCRQIARNFLHVSFPDTVESSVDNWNLFYHRLNIILLNTLEIFNPNLFNEKSEEVNVKDLSKSEKVFHKILTESNEKNSLFYEKKNERLLLTLLLLNHIVDRRTELLDIIQELNLVDEYVKLLDNITSLFKIEALNSNHNEMEKTLISFIIPICYRLIIFFKNFQNLIPNFNVMKSNLFVKHNIDPQKNVHFIKQQLDKNQTTIKKHLDIYFPSDLLICSDKPAKQNFLFVLNYYRQILLDEFVDRSCTDDNNNLNLKVIERQIFSLLILIEMTEKYDFFQHFAHKEWTDIINNNVGKIMKKYYQHSLIPFLHEITKHKKKVKDNNYRQTIANIANGTYTATKNTKDKYLQMTNARFFMVGHLRNEVNVTSDVSCHHTFILSLNNIMGVVELPNGTYRRF
ncbi:hypothetical protein SNEBB_001193 [Seison nebaliae]|nr:hypothetical protein SNEBB_001193 [Seison nebaliae]